MSLQIITQKKVWFIISIIILLLGLVSLGVRGLNLGIDFTGGSILHVDIGEEYQVSEVREALTPLGLEDSVIQTAGGEGGGETEVVIRTESLSEEERNELVSSLENTWPQITQDHVLRTDTVGPEIGAELRTQALLALVIAAIGMIMYITYRFEFNFAVAAITAIIHDAVIVLTVFSLFQVQIDSAFVAAILMIIGYSINDTIVVFDRVRETLKFDPKAPLNDIVITSIRRTITRSLNTSVTTLLVLASLYIFGGITLRPFILALLIGVISGTYSSIFIASNVWSTVRQYRHGTVNN